MGFAGYSSGPQLEVGLKAVRNVAPAGGGRT